MGSWVHGFMGHDDGLVRGRTSHLLKCTAPGCPRRRMDLRLVQGIVPGTGTVTDKVDIRFGARVQM